MSESRGVLAANLSRISKNKGMSRKDLAAATGVSASTIGRIMRGDHEPDAAVLRGLVKVLRVPMRQLFSPAPQLKHIRFRSTKARLNVRQEVLLATSAWLRDYNELEALLDDVIPLRLDLRRHGPEGPEHGALRLRAEMGLDAMEPIYDIGGLLEAHGIKVFTQEKMSDGFFGLAVGAEDGGPAVVVNCNPQISVERWIFSCAHELGHLLLHRGSFQADQQQEIKEEELEADCFAGHFLMPEPAFTEQWHASRGLHPVERVIKVKRHFTVSYKTVLHRLVDTGRASAQVWPSFYKLYQQRYGKSLRGHKEMEPAKPSSFRASFADEPGQLNPLDFKPERLSRMVRDALDQGLISASKAADILGLSLPQMRSLMAAWVDDMVVA